MKYNISSIPSAQTIVELCRKASIKHIVISPGSRNAPLTISFATQPFFNTYSIVDERCAAFFAMGMAQQLQEPTAIVCTSGSAMLNYFPAVAEAFYSQIPLVVISADRPEHLIDVGDGQTIKQPYVFTNHVAYEANLKSDNREDDNTLIQDFNSNQIFNALQTCHQNQLPVHINAPFDEPLYDKIDAQNVDLNAFEFTNKDAFSQVRQMHIESFVEHWNASDRKLVLVGVNHPDDIKIEDLEFLTQDNSVIVMTETTSNLNHERFFYSIDGMIAPIELDDKKENLFDKLQPEIVLTLGGMLVSKKLKAFLRRFKPEFHYHINPYNAYDTFFSDVIHLQYEVKEFFNAIKPQIKAKTSDYFTYWNTIKNSREIQTENYIKNIQYSDFWCYDFIFKNLPKDILLHLGNSSCVRYSNFFDLDTQTQVFCNRGTSGIDGSTSTAIGSSVVQNKSAYLICGDLSFLYDSNALWNDYTSTDFKIIIINNHGGGIFRILPGDKHDDYFHTYFETQHQHTAKHLAKMYGFEYNRVSDKAGLENQLPTFIKSKSKSILEIFTPTELNDKVLLDYFEVLKSSNREI
ncbi:2-succinyl-5-enolpyruvyl-6-hydroxy-3-cyclohexene-1-carboxylic-acid synthase [Mesohalobacter halotolerans]|uniref:2-succinyl-5-enolpyruvyl-6-hydroxy-3-cyclohexene-1-carboxylate synthase n=1 Tax=Mesohalobacter halotolerans TaxID=1883405 RepID=A0A4V6ALA8_9FLAO|nr:2-succinyl-5-enolpyruvyl-6-hydroxy-3-cyclohexene-1-carboxylic-acid synthase [Mesohalobacter halotolerans]TKS55725.1 2-succinyl-5-enolpyruvyl-6-hydroxy-3-cyclohexene-1-carboxylic-acid synthase [Mesohalobacter halotolerans]